MLCYKFITFLLRFCYVFVKKKLHFNITFLLIICCNYITIQKKIINKNVILKYGMRMCMKEKNCKIKSFHYFKNQIEIHFKFKIEISNSI